jgi:hypothetical protein
MSKDYPQQPYQTPDPPPPRLSIAHLMLLTLTTGVSIAVMNYVSQRWAVFISPDLPSPAEQVLRVATRVWRAGMLGMELALAGIVLAWMFRKRPTGIAPGHWILLGLGAEGVVSMAVQGVSVLLLPGDENFFIPYSWKLAIYGSGEFFLAAVWLALAVAVGRGAWRWLLALEGALAAVSTAGWIVMISSEPGGTTSGMFWTGITLLQVGSLGVCCSGLVAVVLGIVDRCYRRRDWLHVMGVVLMALRIVAAVLLLFVPGM